jgi:hypothetical protein
MHQLIKFIVRIVSIYIIINLISCISEAPRDNPLDPANGLTVSGNISRIYTNNPPKNAIVFLQPENLTIITGDDGRYTFSNLKPGNYQLSSTAPGFSEDSATIDLQQNAQIDLVLDSLPYFRDIKITTHHVSRWFPPDDMYSIRYETTASDGDGDGDIEKVWLQIESIAYTDTLQRSSPGSNIFKGEAFTSDLSINSLHELIGKPFVFFVNDLPGQIVKSTNQFLSRIIEDTPQLVSPIGLEDLNSFPITFTWQAIINISYSYSLKIEIFSISLGLKVDEVNDIPFDATTAQFSGPLSTGDYYWILYIIDEFGNSSTSREGSFRIQL